MKNFGWRHTVDIGMTGAVTAIGASVLSAGAVALVYHFPVPMGGGNFRGMGGVIESMMTMVFLGCLGPFFVPIGICGAIVGIIASRLTFNASERWSHWTVRAATCAVGLAAAVYIAVYF